MAGKRKAGPVGLGYMPKGGAKAAQAKNAAWVVENEAAMAARSTAPSTSIATAAAADGAQVRASAPESTADGAPYGGFLQAVERACFVGVGAIFGSLLTLVGMGTGVVPL